MQELIAGIESFHAAFFRSQTHIGCNLE